MKKAILALAALLLCCVAAQANDFRFHSRTFVHVPNRVLIAPVYSYAPPLTFAVPYQAPPVLLPVDPYCPPVNTLGYGFQQPFGFSFGSSYYHGRRGFFP